jgi:hypothetical protein
MSALRQRLHRLEQMISIIQMPAGPELSNARRDEEITDDERTGLDPVTCQAALDLLESEHEASSELEAALRILAAGEDAVEPASYDAALRCVAGIGEEGGTAAGELPGRFKELLERGSLIASPLGEQAEFMRMVDDAPDAAATEFIMESTSDPPDLLGRIRAALSRRPCLDGPRQAQAGLPQY